MRQDDGGWAIPARTRGLSLRAMLAARGTLEADRTQPSSHFVTGIVLRAFAAHPKHRNDAAAVVAGRWLTARLFVRDAYADRAAPSHWLTFSYPFWWTDLVSALDSLLALGLPADDPDLARGLAWLVDHQDEDGLWNPGRNRPKDRYSDQWVGLAVCRVLTAAGIALGDTDRRRRTRRARTGEP